MTCPRTDVKLTLTITLLCKLVNSIFQYFNPQRVNLHCIALQEPEPLPYLAEKNHTNYDIPLEVRFFPILQLHFFATIFFTEDNLTGTLFFLCKVWIKPKDQNDASVVSKTNFKHL
jgi:hypothetical protein